MNIKIITQLLLGLALFLYGMKTMSENLETVAGSRMKKIVELFTSKPIRGVFAGALVTTVIQSSSATTVMVIGFVNAGVMTLYQAIGIIMGANIGTTITGQMVSLNLGVLAPYAIIIGAFGLLIFSKKNSEKHFYILLGFGLLFLGMGMMSSAMVPLRSSEKVTDVISHLGAPGVSNALLGLLIGAAFTAIIQSSSAVTAIIVAMASSGTIGIAAAFPIILGANIGTTVTALLSSIGANKTAKKAALMHLLFNVIGSVLFIVLFIAFRNTSVNIMEKLGASPERQIANTHTIFNVINTILLFPFAKSIVNLVNKMIPVGEEKTSVLHLDERMIETPVFALQMAKKEINRMGSLALASYNSAIKGYIEQDRASVNKVYEIEKTINQMEHGINEFLIKVSKPSALSTAEMSFVDNMFNIIHDIERIGDHAENISDLAKAAIKGQVDTSQVAINEIDNMSSKVRKSIEQSLNALNSNDKALARKVIKREFKVDKLEKQMRKEHIKRLQDGLCNPKAGILFLDVISNIERVADHAENISEYVNDIKE